jgi:acetyltransferase-like isoleucine patch superfamily enzyme
LVAIPLLEGEIPAGSQQEFVYHVHLLFFLILFYPITRSCFVPVPLMRVVLQALGARLGQNSYSSGIVFDPIFVEVGDNSLIGQSALLIPHVIEGHRLAHYRIRIGNNCTIGAGSAVLAGVSIGDGATVSIGAVVKKGTVIGPNEIWGGVPARLIEKSAASR